MHKIRLLLLTIIGLVAVAGVVVWQTMPRELTYDQAVARLARLIKKVTWSQNFVTRRASVPLGQTSALQETLPDIARFPLVVQPVLTAQHVGVEIFTSTEKSGQGTDGWMVEVAEDFNRRGVRLNNGKTAAVQVRKIASGTGYAYIASQKYLPDAFSPSNHLWIKMVQAYGVPVLPIHERLVSNTAGIVMKERVQKTLREKYGQVGVKEVIDAVAQGSLTMGYTDPFASSTGLNFLVTILATYANGDASKMLNDEVISAFETFQRGVPFVSLTTLQMRDSVQRDGSLDAFVMEHQTYVQTAALQSGYVFVPFGVKHDNPLYGIGRLSAEKQDVLQRFAAFATQQSVQQLAIKYGFNQVSTHTPAFDAPAGDMLLQAQKLWKDKKDSGKPITTVFLSDVSGSMAGVPLHNLKQALMTGSQFIAPENAIGLAVFNHNVQQLLPVAPFDVNQRATFIAAVEAMTADGNTAMYDGIAVALQMLIEAMAKRPESKPMLFVLSDGKTNLGLSFAQIKPIIAGLKIPVYTIGYNARLEVLQELSTINEAASLNADAGDIAFQIGAMLNAEM